MIVLVAITVIISVSTIFLTVHDLNKSFERERDKWYEERQILLNRIENPKYQPPLNPGEKRANLEQIAQLKEEVEQFGLVGKIID